STRLIVSQAPAQCKQLVSGFPPESQTNTPRQCTRHNQEPGRCQTRTDMPLWRGCLGVSMSEHLQQSHEPSDGPKRRSWSAIQSQSCWHANPCPRRMLIAAQDQSLMTFHDREATVVRKPWRSGAARLIDCPC